MADRIESSAPETSSVIETRVDPTSARYEANMRFMADLVSQIHNEEETICEGGGQKAIENQHSKARLTARERIKLLVDPGTFFELGAYSAHGMYEEWGGAPAAGVITGLARIHTRLVMIIANDATVKAGAFFPMTAKKVIRAQNIAIENHIPTIYLVDSAGVFLPLQEDVFPDTDDFGRVFRNNAVMSAMGISQIAAIMGMCVAGGGYLPVMCDHVLMTKRRSVKRFRRKNWVARLCTRRSAGLWISVQRVMKLAWRRFVPSWRSGDTGDSHHGIAKNRWNRQWRRKKSTAFTILRRRVLTT